MSLQQMYSYRKLLAICVIALCLVSIGKARPSKIAGSEKVIPVNGTVGESRHALAELFRPARQTQTTVIQSALSPPAAPQVVDTVHVQDTFVGPTGVQVPLSSSTTSQISPPLNDSPVPTVVDTIIVQDTVVPDFVPPPQVVDTVHVQDTFVGPNGGQIPLSSSTSSQISPVNDAPIPQVVDTVHVQDTFVAPDGSQTPLASSTSSTARQISPVNSSPQVVDTVHVQDTFVGPNGEQIPLSSASTSQISDVRSHPAIAMSKPFFDDHYFVTEGFRKREFPDKFQFFPAFRANATIRDVTVNATTQIPSAFSATSTMSPLTTVPFSGKVAVESSTKEPIPTGIPTNRSVAQDVTVISHGNASFIQNQTATNFSRISDSAATNQHSTTNPTELTTTKLIVTASTKSFLKPENISTSTPPTTVRVSKKPKSPKHHITFTLKPVKKIVWSDRKQFDEEAIAPMSRENPEIYSIAARALSQTTTASSRFMMQSDQPIQHDEEPPATLSQIETAQKKALAASPEEFQQRANFQSSNHTGFAEFKPRDYFHSS